MRSRHAERATRDEERFSPSPSRGARRKRHERSGVDRSDPGNTLVSSSKRGAEKSSEGSARTEEDAKRSRDVLGPIGRERNRSVKELPILGGSSFFGLIEYDRAHARAWLIEAHESRGGNSTILASQMGVTARTMRRWIARLKIGPVLERMRRKARREGWAVGGRWPANG